MTSGLLDSESASTAVDAPADSSRAPSLPSAKVRTTTALSTSLHVQGYPDETHSSVGAAAATVSLSSGPSAQAVWAARSTAQYSATRRDRFENTTARPSREGSPTAPSNGESGRQPPAQGAFRSQPNPLDPELDTERESEAPVAHVHEGMVGTARRVSPEPGRRGEAELVISVSHSPAAGRVEVVRKSLATDGFK